MATAIVKGGVTLEDFTESAIRNQDILEVVDRISVAVDNGLKRSDRVDPTRVEIVARDNKIHMEQVEDPLGSLQRPMSFEDCAKKFRDCAQSLGNEKIDRCIELIGDLEKVEDIREIIGLLAAE